MKKFIELTQSEGEKIYVNVDYIFLIEKIDRDEDLKSQISFAVPGYGSAVFHRIHVKENMHKIYSLIEDL